MIYAVPLIAHRTNVFLVLWDPKFLLGEPPEMTFLLIYLIYTLPIQKKLTVAYKRNRILIK